MSHPNREYREVIYTPEGKQAHIVSASMHGHLRGYEADPTPFLGRCQKIADAYQRGVDWQRENGAPFIDAV